MKKSLLYGCVAVAVALAGAESTSAQSALFRSTHSANLPTAAMLRSGDMMIEISHRFDTPISRGGSALWGFDGPVNNRLGIMYAPHDRVLLGLQRSNLEDNVEFSSKVGLVWLDSEPLPVQVAAQGGIAWNTEVFPTQGASDNEMQAYLQLIVNTLIAERFAVGIVPTFVHNPRILDQSTSPALALGITGQVYLNQTTGAAVRRATGTARSAYSIFGEWIVSERQQGFDNDSGAFGFEVRTRGHFFKLLVTNQSRMNQTQLLGGTPHDFANPASWRVGFNITRLLPL